MQPTYETDLPIRQLWLRKEFLDWLHPEHGPLPDYMGQVDCCGEKFRCVLWLRGKIVVVALEMLERSRYPDEELNARLMRGTILQTFRWRWSEEGFHGYRRQVTVPPDPGNDEIWMAQIAEELMLESVHIAATSCSGGYQVVEYLRERFRG